MDLIWTPTALQEWQKVAIYISNEFGKSAVRKFFSETQNKEKQLLDFPESDTVEPLLAGAPFLYRSSIISKYNKIIYYIDKDKIYIVDVWDMRRNPEILRERIL